MAGLRVRAFEERVLPAASTLGTVSGFVFVDASPNHSGVFNAQESTVPGVTVTLTNPDGSVAATATTDAQGDFALRSVQAGTYQLTASPGANFVGGATVTVGVTAGQNTSQNLGIGGLAPGAVHLSELLSSSTQADFPLAPSGATANSAPFVVNPIRNVTLASSGSQTIDLAANFADPDMTTSQIVFDTTDGPMTVNLFDAQAPQTVANFYDYILNDRYDGTIFHRLDTSPPVLQGGGYSLQTSGGAVTGFSTVNNANDPGLQDEATSSAADILGTLAMAQPSNPNDATSGFFFNLANNSSTLGGNFEVFGSVASDPTSQQVFQLLQTPTSTFNTYNESTTNGDFTVLPLNNYTGEAPKTSTQTDASFPGDTTPSNYLMVNDVRVVQRNDSLTYTVSSSNSAVSVGFVPDHPEVLQLTPNNTLTQTTTATITVTATDDFGATASTTFQVTVVPLTITSATNPINAANAATTIVSGTAQSGTSISVVATNGTTTTSAATTTAGTNGTWSVNVNASSLADGTVTYKATATDAAGNTATVTQTTVKDTVAPAVAITSVTNPINSTNDTTTSVSGTVEAGATVSVVATDGVNPPVTVQAVVSGTTWTASPIDVSGLSDGTITYTATATDPFGNTAQAMQTSTKST